MEEQNVFSVKHICEIFALNHRTVLTHLSADKFRGAYQSEKRGAPWVIPQESILFFMRKRRESRGDRKNLAIWRDIAELPDPMNISHLSKITSLSVAYLWNILRSGKFSDAYKEGNEWKISKKSVTNFMLDSIDKLTLKEAANKAGVSMSTIRKYIKEGKIKGAKKMLGKWVVPRNFYLTLLIHPYTNNYEPPEGFLTVKDVAAKTGIPIRTIRARIGSGEILGKKVKEKKRWLVPETWMKDYLTGQKKYREEIKEKMKNQTF